jgi:transcription elongation factor Elf1
MIDRLAIRAATCPVCGSREVASDAVEHGGWLMLAECVRCDHRWTQPFAQATARAAVKVSARARLPEVASAA